MAPVIIQLQNPVRLTDVSGVDYRILNPSDEEVYRLLLGSLFEEIMREVEEDWKAGEEKAAAQ